MIDGLDTDALTTEDLIWVASPDGHRQMMLHYMVQVRSLPEFRGKRTIQANPRTWEGDGA